MVKIRSSSTSLKCVALWPRRVNHHPNIFVPSPFKEGYAKSNYQCLPLKRIGPLNKDGTTPEVPTLGHAVGNGPWKWSLILTLEVSFVVIYWAFLRRYPIFQHQVGNRFLLAFTLAHVAIASLHSFLSKKFPQTIPIFGQTFSTRECYDLYGHIANGLYFLFVALLVFLFVPLMFLSLAVILMILFIALRQEKGGPIFPFICAVVIAFLAVCWYSERYKRH